MKLLVHNLLSSKFLKGVTTGYPLKVVASNVATKEVDFDADFIKKMIPKLDLDALRLAASGLQQDVDLPQNLSPDTEIDVDVLKKLHHLLVEVDVVEGYLECPESGHQFPIKNSIPNMLVNENLLP